MVGISWLANNKKNIKISSHETFLYNENSQKYSNNHIMNLVTYEINSAYSAGCYHFCFANHTSEV